MWRLLKDLKLTDERLTLARINRSLSEGFKNQFHVDFPIQGRLKLAKEHPQLLTSSNFGSIEWEVFENTVKGLELNWEDFPSKQKGTQPESIPLSKILNPHDAHTPVLFRNFVTLLVRVALLQHSSRSGDPNCPSFRQILTDLLSGIKAAVNPVPNLHSEKVTSEGLTNVSHQTQSKMTVNAEYSAVLTPLFAKMAQTQPQLLNQIDQTVSVRQIYSLLCSAHLLKEPHEKMMFLEKIERPMKTRTHLLRKEHKQNYATLEKVVLTSPHFSHIMNYELIEAEFNDIMHLFLNRKIGNTQSKE